MKNLQKILLVIGLILFIVIFMFKDVANGSHVFATPDTQSAAAVGKGMELYKAENGEYPKWNPWIFSGVPATHSLQHISRYYPPNLILKPLNNLGMPNFYNYIIHFVFLGLGCFLILYRKNIDLIACIYSSLAFTLMPYIITMVVHGHGSQMMTSSYIPWIYLFLEKLREKANLKNLSIFALLIGFQLLRGHVQIAYYTWLLIGVFIVFNLINDIKSKQFNQHKSFYLFLTIALFLGFLTSIQLYFPAHSYSPYSIRGGSGGGTGFEYATAWSFSFGEMLTFLNPNYYGFGGSTYWGNMPFTDYPNYMGILSIVFSIYAVFNIKNISIKILMFAWLSALLLSFGHNTPIYNLFYSYFPFFNKFRVPAMFLIILQFSTVILSGLGLNILLKNKFNNYKMLIPFIITLGLLIISNLSSESLLLNSQKSHNILNNIRLEMISEGFFISVIILLLSGLLVFLYNRNFINKEIIGIAIIFFLISDLTNINKRIINPTDKYNNKKLTMKSKDFRKLHKKDDIINFLNNDDTDFRILPLPPLLNDNRWSAFHIENVGGYHPAKLQNYQTLMTDVGFNSPGFLQMLNVKYLISLNELNHPLFELVYTGNLNYQGNFTPTYIYLNKLENNRIIFPKEIIKYNLKSELKTSLKNPYYSPLNTVYSKENDEIKDGINGEGHIVKFTKTADKINTKIQMKKAGLVVFSEIYYPNGWKCTINENLTEIFEINGILRGIYLEKGEQNIEMIFDPGDLKMSKIISNIAFFLILLSLITSYILERKNKIAE